MLGRSQPADHCPTNSLSGSDGGLIESLGVLRLRKKSDSKLASLKWVHCDNKGVPPLEFHADNRWP